MSHISVYRVKAVALTPERLRLLANILARALQAHGHTVEVVEGGEVEDFYGNRQRVDIVIRGRGDPVLQRGLGLRLTGSTPELVADFWGSKLGWVKREFQDLAVAVDYAGAVMEADPSFTIDTIEVGGKEIRLTASSAGWW